MENETRQRISTAELAGRFCVKTETIRRSLCVNGHYLGLRPVKLPNGRLVWPVDEAEGVIRRAAGGGR